MLNSDIYYIKVKKQNNSSLISCFVFFILLLFTFLPPVVPTLFIGIGLSLFGLVWLLSKQLFPSLLFKIIIPFILMIVVGLVGLISYKPYDVLKDAWYFLNPILAISIGYLLTLRNRDFAGMARVFILAGLFVSCVHLAQFVKNPDLLFKSANELRLDAGRGYFLSVIAVSLLSYSRVVKEYWFGNRRLFDWLILLVCLSSVILSYSRELLISLSIFLAAIYGLIDLTNKKRLLKIAIASVVALMVIIAIPKPSYISDKATIIDKFLYSIDEVTLGNYTSLKDINVKWRGYESYRALNTYLKGDVHNYFIGGGFGTFVDLGLFMDLGGEKIRYAPVLHNGYMYLLVKTGVLGLLLYFYFLYFGVKTSNQIVINNKDIKVKLIGRLLAGIVCVILVSTYVIAGLLNKSVLQPLALLMGIVYAQASFYLKSK